jgi:4-oxalocrotonate tautomerase
MLLKNAFQAYLGIEGEEERLAEAFSEGSRDLGKSSRLKRVPRWTSTCVPRRSKNMPHVIVKLWPGKSEQQKNSLADKIARDVMDVLTYGEESVSVGFEEIKSQDWKEKVYKPDIQDKWDKLYKKPRYEM